MGGVGVGVDATDCEWLNDPICDWDMGKPLADPMLPCEYDIGRLGRWRWLLLVAIAPAKYMRIRYLGERVHQVHNFANMSIRRVKIRPRWPLEFK